MIDGETGTVYERRNQLSMKKHTSVTCDVLTEAFFPFSLPSHFSLSSPCLFFPVAFTLTIFLRGALVGY